MTLRELTGRVPLTLANGRLNPSAVGWARQPLVDTAGLGRGRGRNKRWEYWNVITPTHILALTVSAIDYACVNEVWVLDRATRHTWGGGETTILRQVSSLPPSLGEGPARARTKTLEISVEDVAAGTRLRAAHLRDAVSFDVVAELPVGHERLAVVVPWSETRFQYTVKDVARPAHGTLTIEGRTVEVPAGQSWAVLDHGRGRWPYDISWNWGAGSGVSGGRVIGLQLGGQWTVGTGSTENAFSVDGRLRYLPDELTWEYDAPEELGPWHVHGGGLDATLVPFYDKRGSTDFGVLTSRGDQCFGLWSGSFTPSDGERIDFDGIVGWAEAIHNRW